MTSLPPPTTQSGSVAGSSLPAPSTPGGGLLGAHLEEPSSDGRKAKRELSQSKRAAQNRAAQVWKNFAPALFTLHISVTQLDGYLLFFFVFLNLPVLALGIPQMAWGGFFFVPRPPSLLRLGYR
jgi:hypothetical protein